MRRDVMDSLAVLSDREYQQRAWVRKEGFEPGQYNDFDYHVHVLYDDTAVLPNPHDSLGTILMPGDEVERIVKFGRVLDQMLDRHGDVPGEVFIADPQWREVMRLASVALAAMVRAWGLPLAQDESAR
jgi:hypothetical protein